MLELKEQKTDPQKIWYIKNGVRGVNFVDLPRCTATAKSTGKRCNNAQMKGQNGLCCVHSGHYIPGATKGNQRALKHGFHTKAAIEERKTIREILSICKSF